MLTYPFSQVLTSVRGLLSISLSFLLVGVSLGIPSAAADPPPAEQTVLELVAHDPTKLRSTSLQRDLKTEDRAALVPVMRQITADSSQPWDVRAHALTMLSGQVEDREATSVFSREFNLVSVAQGPWGADAFQILAEWASRSAVGTATAAPLLLPSTDAEIIDQALNALAGNAIHHYLEFLDDHNFAFQPPTVTALGQTDDQLTRQFLCWWVGEHRPRGMAPFLLGQIDSTRTSSYRSQVDRVFLALFTAGIGEIIRSAVPTPRWLRDDATPKGLALESLARYYPAGVTIGDPAVVDTLLAATETNASGKKRGQWQLAIDILFFLNERKQPLAGRADATATKMVRQALRKRGPLEPFIAVAELNRRGNLDFPALDAEEQTRIWTVAFKTLDAAFLKAVVDNLTDKQQREQLEQRLAGLGDQAARGTLRIVRCWGADIETPGDWALAVAELQLVETVNDVEGVLDTAWPDEAAEALIRFGAPGAPALGRFLFTSRSRQLDTDLRRRAIENCALNLPEDEWSALLAHLENDPALGATGGLGSVPFTWVASTD